MSNTDEGQIRLAFMAFAFGQRKAVRKRKREVTKDLNKRDVSRW